MFSTIIINHGPSRGPGLLRSMSRARSSARISQSLTAEHRSPSSKTLQSQLLLYRSALSSFNPRTSLKKKSTLRSPDHQMNLISQSKTHHHRTIRTHLHNNTTALHDTHPMEISILPTENGNLLLSNPPFPILLSSRPSLITPPLSVDSLAVTGEIGSSWPPSPLPPHTDST